jgi:hypothetical protein
MKIIGRTSAGLLIMEEWPAELKALAAAAKTIQDTISSIGSIDAEPNAQTPPRQPRRAARASANALKSGTAGTAARPAGGRKTSAADAPCMSCNGPVDRSGKGGYRRLLCKACMDKKLHQAAAALATATHACAACRAQTPATHRLCDACRKSGAKLTAAVGRTTPATEGGAG